MTDRAPSGKFLPGNKWVYPKGHNQIKDDLTNKKMSKQLKYYYRKKLRGSDTSTVSGEREVSRELANREQHGR